jgi:eukaryotic-like serine/threonine-protein kinase
VTATLADPVVGRYLDGRYRVDGHIARGGMAAVYRALDTRLDRTVAVKVMHPVLADDEEFVVRFRAEAKAAARLAHPDAVAVFDQGEDAGRLFLVMEYVAGGTLRELLRDRGPLSPALAVAVFVPVLRALAAAHRVGLVHCDVKPENVLLGRDGRVKVADFGLARAVASSTLTTTVGLLMGTVAYLAPEQVQSARADPRTDVYAAGITLWETLIGAAPYAGDRPLTVAYRHVHDDVPRPATASGSPVPPALDDLVVRATRRDPAARPADAGAFLSELRGLLATGTVTDAEPALAGLLAEVFAIERSAANGPAVDVPGQRPWHDTLVVTGAAPVPVVGGTAASPPGPAPPGPAPPETPPPETPPPETPPPESLPPVAGAPTGSRPLRRRRRRRGGPIAAGILAVLTVMAAVGGWYLGAGRYTGVPSVLGRDRAAADRVAAAAGLHVRYGPPAFSETAPVGTVVTQAPAPRGRILRHGNVTAALSKGPERYTVPDLAGHSLGETNKALADQHLRTGVVTDRFDDTAPAGTVVDTDPSAGTALTRDTAVAVVLSKGLEPVAVPDVHGQPADDATAMLSEARLRATIQEAYDDTVATGSVVSQRPAAGTNIGRGTAVTLFVSKGPQLFAVSDVTGESRDRAVAELTALGFRPQVRALPVGPGRVRAQDPAGGTQARRGATVTLFVF